MSAFKIKLENKSSNKTFKIIAIHYTESEVDIPFKFSNSTKSFERVNLEIEDSNFKLLENIGEIHINPLKRNSIETTINKNKPFNYEVIGTIENKGKKILLDLVSVQYLLKKDEAYYISVRYEGQRTEKMKIQF